MSKNQQLKSILQRQPDFIEDTPLDRYFLSLQKELFRKLDALNAKQQLQDDNGTQNLYVELGFNDNSDFVQMLLDSFRELHSLVLAKQRLQHESTVDRDSGTTDRDIRKNDNNCKNNNLLPISLYDMKFVDGLINLIIVHGIDANLPNDLKIPMESKRLTNFKLSDKRYIVPNDHVLNFGTLKNVLETMCDILVVSRPAVSDNYLRMVVLRGPLYANIFLAALALCIGDPTCSDMETKLQELEDTQETYTLYQMYTLLTQTVTNSGAKLKLLARLTSLVVRRPQNGLISLIDFILGIRENAPVTSENLQRVNELLTSATPRNISRIQYLSTLFDQIYDCLTYVNRPVLVSCVNGTITEFYYKNPRIVRDFLFSKIYAVMFNSPDPKAYSTKEVNDTTNVLISISKNPSRDVIQDLISYGTDRYDLFMLQLWSYCLFLKRKQKLDPVDPKMSLGPYFEVVLSLMKTFIVVLGKYDVLEAISLNLLGCEHDGWEYRIDLETQLPYIEVVPVSVDMGLRLERGKHVNLAHNCTVAAGGILSLSGMGDKTGKASSQRGITQLIQDMDTAIDLFISLLKLLDSEDAVCGLFLKVLKRWIVASTDDSKDESVGKLTEIHIDNNGPRRTKSVYVLLELKLLEKLNMEFKADIIRSVEDLLQLICDLFELTRPKLDDKTKEKVSDSDADSDDDDDDDDDNNDKGNDGGLEFRRIASQESGVKAFQIMLQLLQSILENTPRDVLVKYKDLIKTIQTKLSPNLRKEFPECKLSFEQINKLQLDKDTANSEEPGSTSNQRDEQTILDRQTLNEALRNLSDPLLPIKARGLAELRELIESGSTVITLEHALRLHIQHLGNADPFIYMNVIKGLTALCELNPAKTIPFLVEFYRNTKDKNRLDDILKIGEVFINYIQIQNELFQGKYANMLIDVCLEKIQAHSKLDNRIRMSAMSILGICLRTNAKGIESRLNELLDCVFGILQLETDKFSSGSGSDNDKHVVTDDSVANPNDRNSFLMRRAAIHLVHDLLYNSGLSLLPENYSPRRLRVLLEYVRSRDNDYLVCEQAAQVRDILDQFVNTSFID